MHKLLLTLLLGFFAVGAAHADGIIRRPPPGYGYPRDFSVRPYVNTSVSAYRGCPSDFVSGTPAVGEVVIHDYLVPVAVPLVPTSVFQYLPALSPVVAPAGIAAPQNVQVPSGAQPITAGTTAGPENQIDALIRSRLEAILREKASSAPSDAPPPLSDPDTPQNVGASPGASQELQTRAMTFVGKSCVTCHSAQEARGGVTLVSAQSQWTPSKDGTALDHETIARSVESGRMPKLNAKLGNAQATIAERTDLIAWLRKR